MTTLPTIHDLLSDTPLTLCQIMSLTLNEFDTNILNNSLSDFNSTFTLLLSKLNISSHNHICIFYYALKCVITNDKLFTVDFIDTIFSYLSDLKKYKFEFEFKFNKLYPFLDNLFCESLEMFLYFVGRDVCNEWLVDKCFFVFIDFLHLDMMKDEEFNVESVVSIKLKDKDEQKIDNQSRNMSEMGNYMDSISNPKIGNYVNTSPNPKIENYKNTLTDSNSKFGNNSNSSPDPKITNNNNLSAKSKIRNDINPSPNSKIGNNINSSPDPKITNGINSKSNSKIRKNVNSKPNPKSSLTIFSKKVKHICFDILLKCSEHNPPKYFTILYSEYMSIDPVPSFHNLSFRNYCIVKYFCTFLKSDNCQKYVRCFFDVLLSDFFVLSQILFECLLFYNSEECRLFCECVVFVFLCVDNDEEMGFCYGNGILDSKQGNYKKSRTSINGDIKKSTNSKNRNIKNTEKGSHVGNMNSKNGTNKNLTKSNKRNQSNSNIENLSNFNKRNQSNSNIENQSNYNKENQSNFNKRNQSNSTNIENLKNTKKGDIKNTIDNTTSHKHYKRSSKRPCSINTLDSHKHKLIEHSKKIKSINTNEYPQPNTNENTKDSFQICTYMEGIIKNEYPPTPSQTRVYKLIFNTNYNDLFRLCYTYLLNNLYITNSLKTLTHLKKKDIHIDDYNKIERRILFEIQTNTSNSKILIYCIDILDNLRYHKLYNILLYLTHINKLCVSVKRKIFDKMIRCLFIEDRIKDFVCVYLKYLDDDEMRLYLLRNFCVFKVYCVDNNSNYLYVKECGYENSDQYVGSSTNGNRSNISNRKDISNNRKDISNTKHSRCNIDNISNTKDICYDSNNSSNNRKDIGSTYNVSNNRKDIGNTNNLRNNIGNTNNISNDNNISNNGKDIGNTNNLRNNIGNTNNISNDNNISNNRKGIGNTNNINNNTGSTNNVSNNIGSTNNNIGSTNYINNISSTSNNTTNINNTSKTSITNNINTTNINSNIDRLKIEGDMFFYERMFYKILSKHFYFIFNKSICKYMSINVKSLIPKTDDIYISKLMKNVCKYKDRRMFDRYYESIIVLLEENVMNVSFVNDLLSVLIYSFRGSDTRDTREMYNDSNNNGNMNIDDSRNIDNNNGMYNMYNNSNKTNTNNMYDNSNNINKSNNIGNKSNNINNSKNISNINMYDKSNTDDIDKSNIISNNINKRINSDIKERLYIFCKRYIRVENYVEKCGKILREIIEEEYVLNEDRSEYGMMVMGSMGSSTFKYNNDNRLMYTNNDSDTNTMLCKDNNGILFKDTNRLMYINNASDNNSMLRKDNNGMIYKDTNIMLCKDNNGMIYKDANSILCKDNNGMIYKDTNIMLCKDNNGMIYKDANSILCKDTSGMLCKEINTNLIYRDSNTNLIYKDSNTNLMCVNTLADRLTNSNKIRHTNNYYLERGLIFYLKIHENEIDRYSNVIGDIIERLSIKCNKINIYVNKIRKIEEKTNNRIERVINKNIDRKYKMKSENIDKRRYQMNSENIDKRKCQIKSVHIDKESYLEKYKGMDRDTNIELDIDKNYIFQDKDSIDNTNTNKYSNNQEKDTAKNNINNSNTDKYPNNNQDEDTDKDIIDDSNQSISTKNTHNINQIDIPDSDSSTDTTSLIESLSKSIEYISKQNKYIKKIKKNILSQKEELLLIDTLKLLTKNIKKDKSNVYFNLTSSYQSKIMEFIMIQQHLPHLTINLNLNFNYLMVIQNKTFKLVYYCTLFKAILPQISVPYMVFYITFRYCSVVDRIVGMYIDEIINTINEIIEMVCGYLINENICRIRIYGNREVFGDKKIDIGNKKFNVEDEEKIDLGIGDGSKRNKLNDENNGNRKYNNESDGNRKYNDENKENGKYDRNKKSKIKYNENNDIDTENKKLNTENKNIDSENKKYNENKKYKFENNNSNVENKNLDTENNTTKSKEINFKNTQNITRLKNRNMVIPIIYKHIKHDKNKQKLITSTLEVLLISLNKNKHVIITYYILKNISLLKLGKKESCCVNKKISEILENCWDGNGNGKEYGKIIKIVLVIEFRKWLMGDKDRNINRNSLFEIGDLEELVFKTGWSKNDKKRIAEMKKYIVKNM